MRPRKKLAHKDAEKSFCPKKDGGSELLVSLIFRKRNKLNPRKKSEQKVRCHGKGSTESKKVSNKSSRDKIVHGNASTKQKLISSKFFRHKKLKAVSKKLSSSPPQEERPVLAPSDENKQNANEDVNVKNLRRKRKKKRRKHLLELDEASRLQRRTRYLLIRMKLEQNLIDAYSGEGWKGQSREKIKPTKELQRAKKQILSCKLGIRDAIRQLDSISSVGSIEDSAIAPDGSVHHEHIFCAKCKTNKTFPDNDIILCDGTCNCAFHQKCLDPPLETESIPPGDQGWFCRFCERKMEIIESINAHLGTCFRLDSNWQDIFKEEAALPDGGIQVLDLEEDWPSDDSEDDDYDPYRRTNTGISCADAIDSSSCDTSSSTSLSWSLDGELLAESMTQGKGGMNYQDSIEFDESMDAEIVCGRRQRSSVDYKKLYDEMFGKDATFREQASEDEDWGPTKRRRREKETDAASTLMTLCEGERRSPCAEASDGDKKLNTESRTRRPIFRIPTTAVEKLRQVFAENELPSRSVKDNLANEFGLDPEKVSKWFKNARYMALKARKAGGGDNVCPSPQVHRESEVAKTGKTAPLVPVNCSTETSLHLSGDSEKVGLPEKKMQYNKGSHELLAQSNEVNFEFDDNICLKQIKLLKSKTKKNKRKPDITANNKKTVELTASDGSRETEAKLETLCTLQSRLDSLRRRILTYQSSKSKGSDGSHLCRPSVIYVPVAELKEKA